MGRWDVIRILVFAPLLISLLVGIWSLWVRRVAWSNLRWEQGVAVILALVVLAMPTLLADWSAQRAFLPRDVGFVAGVMLFVSWQMGRQAYLRQAPGVVYLHAAWVAGAIMLLALLTRWPDSWYLPASAVAWVAIGRWALARWKLYIPLSLCLSWPVTLLLLVLVWEAMEAGYPWAALCAVAPAMVHGLLAILPLEGAWAGWRHYWQGLPLGVLALLAWSAMLAVLWFDNWEKVATLGCYSLLLSTVFWGRLRLSKNGASSISEPSTDTLPVSHKDAQP